MVLLLFVFQDKTGDLPKSDSSALGSHGAFDLIILLVLLVWVHFAWDFVVVFYLFLVASGFHLGSFSFSRL